MNNDTYKIGCWIVASLAETTIKNGDLVRMLEQGNRNNEYQQSKQNWWSTYCNPIVCTTTGITKWENNCSCK